MLGLALLPGGGPAVAAEDDMTPGPVVRTRVGSTLAAVTVTNR